MASRAANITETAAGPSSGMRFRRAPLAAAALWFGSGIALGHTRFPPTVLLLGALGLLLLLAVAALLRSSRVAFVPVAALWLTLGMAAAQWQPAAPAPNALISYADNLSRTVRGHVVRVHSAAAVAKAGKDGSVDAQQRDADTAPPWESTEDTARQTGSMVSLDLAVDAVEDVTPDVSSLVPVEGGVRVSVYQLDAATLALRCGDQLEVPLRLKTPDTFRTPGAFPYADYLLGQGIAAHASTSADRIHLLGTGAASNRCRLFAAQAWASERLQSYARSAENASLPQGMRLSAADTAMLSAMLFGDRSGLTHSLRVGFERTGSFHLFVVSGLHIALLAGGVFWILRRMHLPVSIATLLTIAATAAYAALTGFGQPAQRALAMTSVFLLAKLLTRDRDSMNALGAAALFMLVWSPSSLFEASFQMTVLAIVAIAGIAIPLGEQTFLRYAAVTREVFASRKNYLLASEAQFRMMLELWGEAVAALLGRRSRKLPALIVRVSLWALELALIGTVAELVMVLPMAMYFHRAAVFALPANMLVIPLIGLLAPLAVLTFCASLVSPGVAMIPGALTALLLHAVRFAIEHISRLAVADVRVPGPVPWVALLVVVSWGICCWAVRRGRWGALGTAMALPLIAMLVLWPETPITTPGTLEITAIDVGQGDSLLAINPEGGTILMDAGGPVGRHGVTEIVSNFDVGEEVVSPYLWTRRLRRIDIVVLSHAHTDHMGGMAAILRNFHPRELWVGVDPHSPLYGALLAEASALGIVVRHLHAGDQLSWGSAQLSVLAPFAGYQNTGLPRNDDSVVLRMDLGKASVLLAGDAERPSEEAMLAANLVKPVTLLKVGHHGSRTSSTQAFLAAAAPHDAVVSVGRSNTFGHPREEVIARFSLLGTHLFRTDEFGLTSFFLTPDGAIRESVGSTLFAPWGTHETSHRE